MEKHELETEKSKESVKYDSIYDYLAKNMGSCHGEFAVNVTDMSEKESYMLLATIHPVGRVKETTDFYLHADGREEHTKL